MYSKKYVILFAMIFLCFGFSQCVEKKEDTGNSVSPTTPNLEGTWLKTDGQVIYWNKEISYFPKSYETAQLEIRGQVDGVFEAYQKTIPLREDHPGKHGDQALPKTELLLLGTIAYDGKTVMMTDVGDNTFYQCTLTDENTMQCVVWEGGDNALAGRIILKRQK